MRWLLIVAALLLAALPEPRAGEPGDSIRAVIEAQLDALGASDLEAAFAHASPMIQSKFGSPENFGRMVRAGYPMIWRPAGYQMLDLVQTGRGPVQMVLFQDQQGRFYQAAYEMTLVDGVWRIDGVYLGPSPGVAS
ncbi:MAG TPA: DUF4864 domain-containing protein [Thermohalobaculum sp.]|nr:DUF4864 domain-containing protein [Thermohalobaculum sp.]